MAPDPLATSNDRVAAEYTGRIGDHVVHLDEWWEQAVDRSFRLLPVETVTAARAEAH